MENENKPNTFWAWLADNPMTFVILLLIILGAVLMICGYKEGVMSIITGIFGWTKGNDSENKQKLHEAKQLSQANMNKVNTTINDIKMEQINHDEEIQDEIACAKAIAEEYDIDELVDIGNAMLKDHSVFGR